MSFLSRLCNVFVLRRWGDDPGPYDPAQVAKILVVRNDNIGDVICTTPMLDALRRAFPRARIAAVVCTLTEEAISGHRALDKLWTYPKAKHGQYGKLRSLGLLWRMLGRIRRERYDLVLAPRSLFSSSQAWLAYASGGRWRFGPEAKDKKKRWGFFYNRPVAWPPKGIHEVMRCFDLLGHIGVDNPEKKLFLDVPEQAQATVAEFLRQHGLDRRPGPLVINVTRWQYSAFRRWPEERYRRLVEILLERPEGLVITHAPADGPWVAQLMGGLLDRAPVFWSPRLKEFAAIIKAASVFVTVEGGPMHIAAAVGAPQVVIWSKRTPLDVWFPWNAPFLPLKAEGTVEEIQVEQVVAGVEELLQTSQVVR
ncbi:glycosyl transferase family 9 [Desulfarculus baarsii DSM 2075]|uniref:Glycosyl transferase family 9 n=1 Tax=Desulfarculus baarsii (strain ATCC 33931 / DSM 2075 / LMG 7858 / VKM B-1802 / 2st14) TaxID=644282 RepID=E1QID1_DESB2|nr:glycosyltransferase family 9 protein [Desulfarculus baarsii]ADK85448.1 glycosyl transferase family 9 [Desulfarculus baarsii DSM 2075]